MTALQVYSTVVLILIWAALRLPSVTTLSVRDLVGPGVACGAAGVLVLLVGLLGSRDAAALGDGSGSFDEAGRLLLLYASLLLGMAGHRVHRRARPAGAAPGGGTEAWIPPLVVAPLVFIPLLDVVGELQASTRLRTFAVLLLIAYQMGFFWRDFQER
jgi:hypothetical protein